MDYTVVCVIPCQVAWLVPRWQSLLWHSHIPWILSMISLHLWFCRWVHCVHTYPIIILRASKYILQYILILLLRIRTLQSLNFLHPPLLRLNYLQTGLMFEWPDSPSLLAYPIHYIILGWFVYQFTIICVRNVRKSISNCRQGCGPTILLFVIVLFYFV